MNYPTFFDEIEQIKLQDGLANFLGSTEGGIIEFNYIDIVKAAGHSCPTVLGAYLLTLKGLKVLYKNEIPKRGEIQVEFNENIEQGVAGVIANVISNITGATTNTGFKGLAGQFSRVNLMEFEREINSSVKFTRIDSRASVELIYDPSSILPSAGMRELMQKSLSGQATDEEAKEFGKLWQQRVENIAKNVEQVISVVQLWESRLK